MAGQVQWRGPNIITEGLLFYMNSSSPSCYNTSSYFGGGSTLRNISGFTSYSGSLTLVNNTTDNNYSGGNVFTFPSSTSNINLGDPTELRLGTNSFTISAWVKLANTNWTSGIVIKRQGSGTFNSVSVYQGTTTISGGGANVTPSKKINLSLRQDSSNVYYIQTAGDIADGTWKHITVTRNSSIPSVNMYINNIVPSFTILSNTGVGILSNVSSIGNPWIIGNISPTPLVGWNSSGPISSVQIYNRALSVDELTYNYNNSKALYGL